MTSIIKLEVLSGAGKAFSPPAYLLQVDEFRFLLDCGCDWSDDDVNRAQMDVKKHNMSCDSRKQCGLWMPHVKQIDAVLLSHPDPHHLGEFVVV